MEMMQHYLHFSNIVQKFPRSRKLGWGKLLWSGFEFHAIIAWCNYGVVLRCKSLKYFKVKNGKVKKVFDLRTEIKS